MPYSKDLGLLQDTLKKCRVSSNLVLPTEPISTAMDFCIKDIIKGGFEVTPSVQAYIGSLDKNTVYRYIDEFGLSYLYLKLTDEFGGPLLFIGPYLASAVGEQELLELGENGEIRIDAAGKVLSFERASVAKLQTYFQF
jgi:hypothetical protein